jgi:glutamine amidotransferase-like uncharacterized protein
MNLNQLRAGSAILLAVTTSLAFTACDSSSGSPGTAGSSPSSTSTSTTPTPVLSGTPTPSTRNFTTDVMVFTGDGTWSTEISDAEALFTANGATYQEVNSAQLDAMTPAQMAAFGIIFMPGGEGSTEAESVSATTHGNLRTAVQSLGLGYVGFCAGAFVAVAPTPASGQDVSYGFGVVNGALLNYYTGPGSTADYELTLESFPDGSTQNILWYGGPVTPSTGVIAKYPTGDPAISEMWSGNGFVIIAGVHPDLSSSSLDSLGVSPDTNAQSTAWKIFNAAITQTALPTF